MSVSPQTQVVDEQQIIDAIRDGRSASGEGRHLAARDHFETALSLLEASGAADGPDAAFVLNELSTVLRRAGRFDQAVLQSEGAMDIAARSGIPADRRGIYALNLGLAAFDALDYQKAQDAFDASVGLLRESGHPARLAIALTERGKVAQVLGRYDPALADWREALSLGSDDSAGLLARLERLQLIARLHLLTFETAETRRVIEEADALRLDPTALPAARTLETDVLRGRLLIQEGQLAAAQGILEAVTAAAGQIGGTDLLAGSAYYNLAEISFARGHFAEADRLNRRAAELYGRALPAGHYVFSQIAHRRAILLQEVGDLETSLDVYDVALDETRRLLGTTHPQWIATAVERARGLERAGRPDAAIEALDAILAQPLPPRQNLIARSALALTLAEQRRDAEAAPRLEEAVRIWRSGRFGLADAPPTILALAEVRLRQGEAAAALDLAAEAAALFERFDAGTIDRLSEARRIRAEALATLGRSAEALALAEENVAAARRQLREAALSSGAGSGLLPPLVRRQIGQVMDLRWQDRDPVARRATAEATEALFAAAQTLQMNEVSGSARRTLAGVRDANAAALSDWIAAHNRLLALERQLQETVRRPGVDPARLDDLRGQIIGAEEDLDAETARMRGENPDLLNFLVPQSVSVHAVQAALGAGEALWLQATFADATYLFLVTRDEARARRVPLGAAQLKQSVEDLRATLDLSARGPLPEFAAATAHALYEDLFGGFAADMDSIRNLYLVPDLAAQEISLATLVIGRRDGRPLAFGTGNRDLRFLGHETALTILPSVQLLTMAVDGDGGSPRSGFVGFGDPTLEGSPSSGSRTISEAFDALSGLADPAVLRSVFGPLPEARLELEQMRSLDTGGIAQIFLGDAASERVVRRTDLRDLGTVVFATHAVVAGELGGLVEPALVLTPPDMPTPADDGLLLASEIASLDISARLVILSACNTGAGSGRSGAPGLSGLARAFWLSGSETLLVSHWAISSMSAAMITPIVYEQIIRDPDVAPAEALRRVMTFLAAIEDDEAFSHPAYWAAFSVVGRS